MILPFIYVCNPKILLPRDRHTTILAAKVQTNFCNLFANMEKSNNQEVKEGKISPWR